MFLGRGFEFRHGAVREWEERFASLIAEEARGQCRGKVGKSRFGGFVVLQISGTEW